MCRYPLRVTTPLEFFGYNLGDDYKLTPWQTREVPGQGMRKGVVEYAYELQRTSSRVHVVEMGKSTLGRPMIYLVITSPDNWARIDQLKAINRKLADPRQIVFGCRGAVAGRSRQARVLDLRQHPLDGTHQRGDAPAPGLQAGCVPGRLDQGAPG